MANKKKIATSVAAVATAAALLLGGTFAWQSISQTALNEASDVVNPGGRLHDDFDGTNKDVYVENFADENIYARVRLEEYFEITMNKGTAAEKTEIIVGGETETYSDDGTKITDDDGNPVMEKTYEVFTAYTSDVEFDAAISDADDEGNTTSWWTWTTGGSTQYLPTFNLNKDSLAADVNGTYDYVDPDTGENVPYGDYVDYLNDYTAGASVEGDEVYDADTNNRDEGDDAVEGTNITTVSDQFHYIAETGDATLISMYEWMTDYSSEAGPYWVYDEDGWVYWAQAIGPDTATGLLLDSIELNGVMDDSWYYAINVVAQFVTADDLGRGSGTGFYDLDAGTAPSENALALLEKIGVDTKSIVSDEAALIEALAAGGNIEIKGTVAATESETNGMNVATDFMMSEGGTVTGGTITGVAAGDGETNPTSYATLFINNENNWPVDGDGANEATLNDVTVNSESDWAVYIQAIDAPVTMNDVTITGKFGGLLAEYEAETVTLNDVTITAESNHSTWWVNTAVAVANGATIDINGGSYTGTQAVMILSSGGTINIYDGYFDGVLMNDAGTDGAINIMGGTFTVDPTDYVASGYEVVTNDDGTYTVQEVGIATLTFDLTSGEYNLDELEIEPDTYKLVFTKDSEYISVTNVWSACYYSAYTAPEITQDDNGNWFMTVTEDHNVALQGTSRAGDYDFEIYIDYEEETSEYADTADARVFVHVKVDDFILFMFDTENKFIHTVDGETYTVYRNTELGTESDDVKWTLTDYDDDTTIAGLTLKEHDGEYYVEWEDVDNRYNAYTCTLTVSSGDESITITLNLLSRAQDSDADDL